MSTTPTTPADGTGKPTFQVNVVTPYLMFFDAPADMLVVTGTDGEIGILAGHTPMVAALAPGELRLRIDGQWRIAAASDGYIEVGPSLAVVVVNSAEWPEEIDAVRARRALERAQSRLEDPDTSKQEKERSRLAFRRAEVRLKVAGKMADRAKGDFRAAALPADPPAPADHSTEK